jgi:hypothetical protein
LSKMRDKDRTKWVMETVEAMATLKAVLRDLNAYHPPTLRELGNGGLNSTKAIQDLNDEIFALNDELEMLLEPSELTGKK